MKALPDRRSIRRILILKWSALGDVALASAIMEDIRRAFPQARIDLDTLPAAAGLFAHDPRFARVLTIDSRARGQRLRMIGTWLRSVRAGRYDLLIDLQGSDHTRGLVALAWLTGCGIRHRWSVRPGWPFTLAPRDLARTAPAAHRMHALLACADIPATTALPVLHPAPAETAQAQRMLRDHGLLSARFAVLLPGSQAAGWLKRWGAARYAELAGLLLARDLERIVVIGGPDERDECAALVAAINRHHPDAAIGLTTLSLLQIVPICAAATLIVANDTGTAHIAAAAGTPLLVICGPTDPQRVKPLGPLVRAVQADFSCLNCYGKRCRLGATAQCLEPITPARIASLLLDASPDLQGLKLYGSTPV